MNTLDSTESKKQKKLALIWSVTFLILFPSLIVLGLLMRMGQGEITSPSPLDFYSYMTLHGLGMVGVLYSMAFAGLWYLLSTRYIKLNRTIGYFVYFTIITSLAGLTIGTLIGKFEPGWYMLYPLHFVNATWNDWATGLSTISLIVLGVAWLIGILHVLYVLARKYKGFSNLLGWQYLRSQNPEIEISPLIMITTISLVPGVFACLAGAILLLIYLLQFLDPSLQFDPLGLKNLVMFFGHTLANIIMYCAVGWVYALLPEFTRRKWKMDKVLVYSWNATFFFILFAFFHHMYMDFVQPIGFQIAGQVISYMSAVPATAITMFGVISQLYRSNIKWTIVPLMFLMGIAGWAVGGFAAVVDSTIVINEVMHNTLWVPAHFHTYLLLGSVLLILGFLFYLFTGEDSQNGDSRIGKIGFWAYILGGYGFVLMFYLGGLESVPRRFSNYSGTQISSLHNTGMQLAHIAVCCIVVVLLALLLMYVGLFKNLFQNRKPIEDPSASEN